MGDLLSESQRAGLRAIVDTFVAPVDAGGGRRTPAASDLGVVEAVEAAVARAPRAVDRKQSALLFGLFGSRAMTALGGGGAQRFADLELERREAVLRAWADSRLAQRRNVFHALRGAALAMAYMLPTDPAGAPNPMWDLIGYPGVRPDPPPGRPLAPLQPLEVTGDTALDCDVVVVGSGAGGATAAAVLAQAGLDVIVVEAGGYHAEDHYEGSEYKAVSELYFSQPTHDGSVGMLGGTTLGGSTVVNYTTSFRTPEHVRAEWAALGATTFASDAYTAALDAVCERTGVNQEHNTPSARDRLMQAGLKELGWHSDLMPRNVRGCKQDARCGYCGYGCPYGAKQNALVTWLQDHAAAAGRVLVDTRVDRIAHSGGQASGVEGVHAPTGSRVTIRSRAVVCAAGALQTPALLRRSGFANANIGRHLRLHPATAVWGVFDEEVRGWEGTMQAVYSSQFADLDGEGYGFLFETAPLQPLLLFSFAPWRSAAQSFELMQALPHTSAVGVLLRDKGSGEVRVGRDGHPVARYRLSDVDRRHVHIGVENAARVLHAAGARRIYSSHARVVETRTGDIDDFARQAASAGYGSGQITFGAFHIMGSARMGGHPTTAACDPLGQTYDVRDVVICDGSAFPTASGVNPQISIMAIAHMNATALAARLT